MASLTGVVDELRDAAWELDAAVSRSGLVGRITSGYRSRSDQTRLYRAYQSGRTAFPVAAPGFSAHEYGEAFDYVVSPYEYQPDVGAYWVSMGGEWGGAADMVHFVLAGASTRAQQRGQSSGAIAELAQKYNDLPWWATIALPIASATTERTASEQERFSHPLSFLCRTYGLFCGK